VYLAIKYGELDLKCSSGVGNMDIKLERTIIATKNVHVLERTLPVGSLRVGRGDAKPIVVVRLIHGGDGEQSLVLLLRPLLPCLSVRFVRSDTDSDREAL
jgi:hypothetical protein